MINMNMKRVHFAPKCELILFRPAVVDDPIAPAISRHGGGRSGGLFRLAVVDYPIVPAISRRRGDKSGGETVRSSSAPSADKMLEHYRQLIQKGVHSSNHRRQNVHCFGPDCHDDSNSIGSTSTSSTSSSSTFQA